MNSRYRVADLRPAGFALLLTVVLLGMAFRVANLDGKVYWHDEAYTALRISGYTQAEVRREVFNGKPIAVSALEKYQRPHADRGIGSTIKSLAIDDAQHSPLYYILVKLWVQAFGNSISAIRSFSVLTGLLVLPIAYFFCQELFASSLVSWLATALIAVSPFHVLYAQEAREYVLWTAMVLLASWALLRALRLKTGLSWAVYGVAIALGLYTYLFMGLTAIGHGAYVLAILPPSRYLSVRPLRVFRDYLLTSIAALLTFAPWLWFVITTWSQNGASWTALPAPIAIVLKKWGLNLERGFLLTPGDFNFDILLVYLTLPLLILLVIYALYVICRRSPTRVWWFVLTLIGSTALLLALPDLILGGQRSVATRYFVPCYLGIQLAVAYLFAYQLAAKKRWKRRFWQGVIAIVLLSGIVSDAITSPADTSWNKVISYNNRSIAQIVNQSERPLLISSSFGINFGTVLSLSHLLDPKVNLQLVEGSTSPDYQHVPQLASGFNPVYLLNVTNEFRRAIEQQQKAKTKLVFSDSNLILWQLQ